MSSLVGAQVVRGPDWKWGDQDGGEGHTGTVIPTSDLDLELFGPRTITVLWDSGLKFTYQGGPEGSYDLRIIDNAAMGVRHPNTPCDNESCWVQEIQGIRWQCIACNINLCTSCFLHEIPHRINHNEFRRFDNDSVDEAPTVLGWYDGEADSRIKLKGIYPGATVSLHPEWPYGREDEKKRGVVISAPREEINGRIVVEWHPNMERIRYQRTDSDGKVVLRLKEPGIGGFYEPDAFPIADSPPVLLLNKDESSELSPVFSVGDRVQVDPAITIEEFGSKQKEVGGSISKYANIGVVGTVHAIHESKVYVRVKDRDDCFNLHPAVLKKLNKFSVNQIIRIRSDEMTIQQIEKRFLAGSTVGKNLVGAIGRVSYISEENPDHIYVHFNKIRMNYRIFFGACPLPSAWMEQYENELVAKNLSPEEEVVECATKIATLFSDAVERGDLKVAKMLHEYLRIDLDELNVDGMTVLQVACEKGHNSVVKWLINDVKVDLDVPSLNGFRAVHYAVKRCRVEVLKILIERSANLDLQTDCGKTALHIAVSNQFTDCSRLLINGGCGFNIKDSDGNTPLHLAILKGSAVCIEQILPSLFVNMKLRNKMGFNVLHLAVIMDDLKAIELIMDKLHEKSPLLELMPNSEFSVLHYTCIHKNFQVAKLLVEKIKDFDADHDLLTHLLEMKNDSGKTAILISCQNKDYALVEFLVEAGADLRAVDQEGNSAIILAASSTAEDETLSKVLSPTICRLWPMAWNIVCNLPSSLPIMYKSCTIQLVSLIAFLMTKGCSLETINKAGKNASDVLQSKGYPENIAETLNQIIQDIQKGSLKEVICMGQNKCAKPPIFQLSCPHKPTYKLCSKCVVSVPEEAKCGCAVQEVSSIRVLPSKQGENHSEMNGFADQH